MTVLPHHFPHGGGIEAAARKWNCQPSDILDLSTGLHPAGQPSWLSAWLAKHAALAAIYPDKNNEPARSILAQEFGVQEEQVWVVAGAQAIIETIFQAMPWQSLAIQVPCYNEPIRCAQRSGCNILAFEHGQAIPQADALWWTSPSNPFGTMQALPRYRQAVLDESYMTFARRRTLGLLPNTIRLGSLTKTFCIPGLRLGYVIASKDVIAQLKHWLAPWSTSTLSLHLLASLLPEADERDAHIQQSRQRLEQLLQAKHWQYHHSEASFILARPPETMPDFAQQRLLVRHFPEWQSLQGWVRLGFPYHKKDWQRLEQALCPSR